jgi:hypothetical protein
MKELFLDGLTIAYAFAGILCCLAYFPTIKDLYLHKKASANTTTYLLWTVTASITLLYSFFILPDAMFRVISIANFLFCSVILFLSSGALKSNKKMCSLAKRFTY